MQSCAARVDYFLQSITSLDPIAFLLLLFFFPSFFLCSLSLFFFFEWKTLLATLIATESCCKAGTEIYHFCLAVSDNK